MARLKQDDSTVPYRKNGYWYSTRFAPGKEHPIFARRKALAPTRPKKILLDANEHARAAHEYYQIGALEVSPDWPGWPSARTPSAGGSSRCASRILSNGEILPSAIANVEADVAWAADNRTVLYVEKDPETLLGLYVKKHVLGRRPARPMS